MPRRSPFLLWRFITADVLRLLVLSAAVLVTVIAFAAAVKPISDGLLQAQDLLRFIFFAIPPMLAFALPFAAGFASTLVYHRLSQDNETLAAHAGGISHRSLLIPAMIVGLILAASLVVLNEQVIPRFLVRMQRLITRDLATWVVQEIEKGRAVDIGGMTLFADSAQKLPPDAGSAATDLLLLNKFAAIERDATGTPTTEVTSERGWIWLFPWEGESIASEEKKEQAQSRVVMRLEHVIGMRQGQGLGTFKDQLDVSWTVPNPFRDNPKFLTFGELRELPSYPERMGWIDLRRKELAWCMAERRATTDLRAAAQTTGIIELVDDQGRAVSVTTSGMTAHPEGWKLNPPRGGPVTIRLARRAGQDDRPTIITAPDVVMIPSLGGDRLDRAFDFKFSLTNASVTETTAAGAATTQRPTYRISALRPAQSPLPELLAMGTPRLLELATTDAVYSNPDPKTRVALDDLSKKTGLLVRQVLAKQHERMAIALSTLVMVLTGAVTSMRLSKRLPLTVYMFTFFPAILCLVTISGGQQATLQTGWPGLVLMWSGVGGLAIYTYFNYKALIRH
ncbi:MAG: LptF/LptG family permease [Planctomycetes bacterium]|nr:LptF/LptG family permease [Planctomycetota bacterium]